MSIRRHISSCERPIIVLLGIFASTGLAYYAVPPAGCVQPLCVNRIDDSATAPVSGMLRFAVMNAPARATITFDPGMNGQTITLDGSSPNNHIKISQDVTIQGPGAGLLTISGGNATRIFFIAAGRVSITGVTLANGFAKGGDGATGGGGGAAGMGGAVFVNSGSLTLSGVAMAGNRAAGGAGTVGGGTGGGGGFGGGAIGATGASGGDLGGAGGVPGTLTAGPTGPCTNGGAGGPGGGGGAGFAGSCDGASGSRGGDGGFGGGGGSGGSGSGHHVFYGYGAAGGAGGVGGGGGGGGSGQVPCAGCPGGGGAGGAGGFAGGSGGPVHSDASATPGGGGAGLGGAIFASNGGLQLINATFMSNSTNGGAGGGADAGNGQAKGGAIFVCSPSLCGPGHNASAITPANTSFTSDTAADVGKAPACPGRDDVDVCGSFSASAAAHFQVSVPSSILPGTTFPITVYAVDGNNNLVFTYSGTLHFSSSDPLAGLPPNTTLTNGVGTFSATLLTPGNQTIMAADTVNSSVAGTSSVIAVAGTTPTHFAVSAPISATSGVPFSFSVTALDANNNVTVAYTGTVHFTSSDPNATLPANSTLSQGVGNFSAALFTGPTQTITATDSASASITGTSNAIAASYSGVSLAATGASPNAGTGSQQTVTFGFTDPYGWEDLSVVNVLINNFLDGRAACYLAYVVPSRTLFLVDDGGDAGGPFAGSVALGNSNAIQNSQCGVALVSATGSGASLSITLNITFKSAFGGNKISYLAARDVAQDNTGWQALGVWQAPWTPAGTISVTSIAPTRGVQASGTAGTFTLTLTDSKGASHIGIVNLLVNNFIDGRQACYLAYVGSSNSLDLVDDGGHAQGPYAGSMVLNGSGTIQNSQCSVNGAGSSAVLAGNTLTLTLNITFKSTFAGDRILYVAGRDGSGGNNTDWQAVGTWTVQ